MKKIIILGAGISGLTAAWFLKKKYPHEVALTLIEKGSRVGGWIRTVKEKGFLFEEGPRGFRPSKATLELVQELGLQNQLIASSQSARKRYLYLEGKLQPFNLWFLIRQGLLSAAVHDLFSPPSPLEDETIAAFTMRRFNNRLAENLMDPLTKGIFGGDFHKLSMRSCLPLLWNYEKQKGSVIRGFLAREKKERAPAALYTFKEGMETLALALAKQLNSPILFSTRVQSLKELKADMIISTLPTSELAKLTNQEDPLEYATLSTVHCGWNSQVLKKRGYGFLIPSKERSDILGMTWDSEIFPELNQNIQTRLCIMMAGQEAPQARALQGLKHYLGITLAPAVCHIHTAKDAIPQYTLNYFQRMDAFKKKLPTHLYAIGHCFDGIGINECIFNARKLVNELSFS